MLVYPFNTNKANNKKLIFILIYKQQYSNRMKKITTIAFILSVFICNAQDTTKVIPSVEKSVFGIQTGWLGIYGYNESRLSNTIALRSEIGFDGGFWGGSFYPKTGFIAAPILTVEPRVYYNLKKRISKSKRIDGNSGNFVSLKTSFHPDWFVISNYKDVSVVSDISIIPSWGIRRHIGKHFNYEVGAGLGYRYYFAKSAGYLQNESDVAFDLRLRIGYTF
ncbi:hypothetical protein ACFOG5_21250 [Pedobacter fastidiosus]